jgi:hypothetical protein
MVFIACLLALFVIFLGAKLLAQTRKEDLGKLFKCISWFLLVMGFLILMSVGYYSTMRICHKGECKMEKKCKSYKERDFENRHSKCCSMHHSMMNMRGMQNVMCRECGDMRMQRGSCNNNMMMCQHANMESNNESLNDCMHKKGNCEKESGECMMKKDTVKAKIITHTK